MDCRATFSFNECSSLVFDEKCTVRQLIAIGNKTKLLFLLFC